MVSVTSDAALDDQTAVSGNIVWLSPEVMHGKLGCIGCPEQVDLYDSQVGLDRRLRRVWPPALDRLAIGIEMGERSLTLQCEEVISSHNACVGDDYITAVRWGVLDGSLKDSNLILPHAYIALDKLGAVEIDGLGYVCSEIVEADENIPGEHCSSRLSSSFIIVGDGNKGSNHGVSQPRLQRTISILTQL